VKVNVICAATVVWALTTGLAQAAQNTTASDLVKRECSTCHGPRGISVAAMFPNLAGQQAVYLKA
jgi:cytochrome c553